MKTNRWIQIIMMVIGLALLSTANPFHATLPVNGQTIEFVAEAGHLEAQVIIDDTGAGYPLPIARLLRSQASNLTPSDAADDDRFGISVAISGETAVVGAHGKGCGGGDLNCGAAYVFERNQGGPGNWGQVKKLTASDLSSWDWFGGSVAISGDTIVVGANGQESGGSGRGAAYVFDRDKNGPDNWGQVKKLTASDAEDSDSFGSSVAISGDTIVVGADREDGAGDDRGAAYVFDRDKNGPDNWGQVKKLTASDAEDEDWFGGSVSISGDIVVVGTIMEDGDGACSACGAAYVFERDKNGPDNWGQVKKLAASDAGGGDWFGRSVAIGGDILVVGSAWDFEGFDGRGAAYIFGRNQDGPDNWGQVKKLTPSDDQAGDDFGTSVAISGDTVIVGASRKDGAGNDRGAAYLFRRNQGGTDNWGQMSKLTAPDAEDGDRFGWSVGISGDSVVVGAPFKGSDRGGAYTGDVRYEIYLPIVIK